MIQRYVPGTTRCVAAYLWLGFMSWVAHYWLGVAGIGMVCVAATSWLRDLWSARERWFVCDGERIDSVWVMPMALCVRGENGHAWLCRDECPPAQWAAILRWLRGVTPSV